MRTKQRRWFQFKLSTWFVLIAIAAWAMTLRPYLSDRLGDYAGPETGSSGRPIYHVERGVNPQLIWPTVSLAAFGAWKLAWRFVERRRTFEHTE